MIVFTSNTKHAKVYVPNGTIIVVKVKRELHNKTCYTLTTSRGVGSHCLQMSGTPLCYGAGGGHTIPLWPCAAETKKVATLPIDNIPIAMGL